MNIHDFKNMVSLENRILESKRIREKYPDKIPCIIEPHKYDIYHLIKSKMLVPKECTIGQLIYIIRKKVKISQEQSLYVFVNNNILPPSSMLLKEIDSMYRDSDGFLYMMFTKENTFG